jgi:hypothetical protein
MVSWRSLNGAGRGRSETCPAGSRAQPALKPEPETEAFELRDQAFRLTQRTSRRTMQRPRTDWSPTLPLPAPHPRQLTPWTKRVSYRPIYFIVGATASDGLSRARCCSSPTSSVLAPSQTRNHFYAEPSGLGGAAAHRVAHKLIAALLASGSVVSSAVLARRFCASLYALQPVKHCIPNGPRIA